MSFNEYWKEKAQKRRKSWAASYVLLSKLKVQI